MRNPIYPNRKFYKPSIRANFTLNNICIFTTLYTRLYTLDNTNYLLNNW